MLKYFSKNSLLIAVFLVCVCASNVFAAGSDVTYYESLKNDGYVSTSNTIKQRIKLQKESNSSGESQEKIEQKGDVAR